MTDVRKVWALIGVREASDSPGDWWHEGWVTSARFVDAAVLTELVDAAREVVAAPCDHHHGKAATPELETYCFTLSERCPCSHDDLRAALAAFDAAMRLDGETP